MYGGWTEYVYIWRIFTKFEWVNNDNKKCKQNSPVNQLVV